MLRSEGKIDEQGVDGRSKIDAGGLVGYVPVHRLASFSGS